MKALIYQGAKSLKYGDWQENPREKFEAKIKTLAAGICGSDLHAYLGHDPRRVPPMILGHEVFGEVVEGSPEIIGKKVVVNPLVNCGKCDYCKLGRENLCPNRYMIGMHKQGGFAEFFHIHEKKLFFTENSSNPFVEVLTEPLACTIHAVNLIKKALFKKPCDCSTLIIGAGAIGLLSAIALKKEKFGRILVCEKNPLRQSNLTEIEGIEDAEAPKNDERFDIVIDAVGMDATRKTGLEHILPGGVFLHIGLGGGQGGLDVKKITLDEIFFLGTYTYTDLEFQEALHFLGDPSREKELRWCEVREMKNGGQAFEDILQSKTKAAKIILVP